MKGWNPFGKVDMEIATFLKPSRFNKQYQENEKDKETDKPNKETDKPNK